MDADFKLDEHLLWSKDGTICTKIDYGICDKIGREDFKSYLINRLKQYIKNLKNRDPHTVEDFTHKLSRYGINEKEVEKLLSAFFQHTN